jgi:O-antigen/teichoic acid export membrane protein
LLIVVLSREVLAVFGERYVEGVAALVIVAFAQLYSSSVGPTPRMLAMTENQNVVMAATAVAALVGLAVSVPLIYLSPTPEGKILGAAIGMATGIVVENTATLLAVRRRLGFWPYNLAWAKPLVAAVSSLTWLMALLSLRKRFWVRYTSGSSSRPQSTISSSHGFQASWSQSLGGGTLRPTTTNPSLSRGWRTSACCVGVEG